MFARIIQAVFLGSLALLSVPAFAGETPEQPNQDELRQQFRQMREQFMQNMTQQGIDPQQFFGEIRQQMQDGSLDLSGLQKKLVDKGLIDEKAISQMQLSAQTATLANIRRQLGVNDAEWATLQPKIQRVITASADVNSANPLGGAMAGLMRGQTSTSNVAKKARELQTTIANQAATPSELQQKLAALREARQKAKEELEAAQKDLTEVLTVSQEGTLTLLGLL